jgi:hypothetical protein
VDGERIIVETAGQHSTGCGDLIGCQRFNVRGLHFGLAPPNKYSTNLRYAYSAPGGGEEQEIAREA